MALTSSSETPFLAYLPASKPDLAGAGGAGWAAFLLIRYFDYRL